MTVSLLEILVAARAHVAPLAAESAGYLLLAVADLVVAAPRAVTPEDVELQPDGSVRLRPGAAANDVGPEPVLRQLLARTLEVSSSVGPALRRAAQRSEDAGLPALVRELEIALIPVNRSAAKRALSRVHRETERAKKAGKLVLDAAPIVAAPVVAPVVAPVAESVDEPIALAADYPEPSASAPSAQVALLPVVVPAPPRVPQPAVAAAAPAVEFTPEPRLAVGEPAFTKAEPVVQRAKERGNSTPRLGTLVTLQTLPGEDGERTERAPAIALEAEELELSIDVELEAELASVPQPLHDPEPSRMPDVLTAMLELHTGVYADEAPTRIRDVVTELRAAPAQPLAPALALTPPPALALTPPPAPALALTPAPDVVEDAWLTHSSLSGVVTAPRLFESELADPAVHDALTWNPGPVAPAAPPPPALFISQPSPELSPYAPAVLPARTSDVSELLDSFYVSDAAEERELRSALKGMAGLELTPMPHPYVEES